MYKCKDCNKEFMNIKGICIHRQKQHGVFSRETYIDVVLKGVPPKCGCGCSEEPNFLSGSKGFLTYILGHAARVNNNWGHNPEAVRKSHETQKKMYDDGDLVIWNKGLTIDDPRVKDNIDKVMSNPERGKNISKKLTGVFKTQEHKDKLRESQIISWSNQVKRDKQSKRQIKQLIKNNYRNRKTKLEIKFEELLTNLGFKVNYQHELDLGLFDFYLIGFNVLIEVDGDFHHSNPKTKHYPPKYPIQFNTIKNDMRKNKICTDNNIKLIRFWENDVNKNIDWVISELKRELNL